MSHYIYDNFEDSAAYRERLIDFLRHNTNAECGGLRIFDGSYSHMLQIPEELTGFITALKAHEEKNGRFERYLEIGFASGVTNTVLNKFFDFGEIVAVDMFSATPAGNTLWANLRHKNLTVVCGDSTSKRTLERASAFAPYDLVFIDGNHTYDYVKQDFANFSKLLAKGGVLALHDIAASDWPDVPRFWEEVKASGEWEFQEFICRDYPTHFGIGMLTRK